MSVEKWWQDPEQLRHFEERLTAIRVGRRQMLRFAAAAGGVAASVVAAACSQPAAPAKPAETKPAATTAAGCTCRDAPPRPPPPQRPRPGRGGTSSDHGSRRRSQAGRGRQAGRRPDRVSRVAPASSGSTSSATRSTLTTTTISTAAADQHVLGGLAQFDPELEGGRRDGREVGVERRRLGLDLHDPQGLQVEQRRPGHGATTSSGRSSASSTRPPRPRTPASSTT